jgi:hypothetical protein
MSSRRVALRLLRCHSLLRCFRPHRSHRKLRSCRRCRHPRCRQHPLPLLRCPRSFPRCPRFRMRHRFLRSFPLRRPSRRFRHFPLRPCRCPPRPRYRFQPGRPQSSRRQKFRQRPALFHLLPTYRRSAYPRRRRSQHHPWRCLRCRPPSPTGAVTPRRSRRRAPVPRPHKPCETKRVLCSCCNSCARAKCGRSRS